MTVPDTRLAAAAIAGISATAGSGVDSRLSTFPLGTGFENFMEIRHCRENASTLRVRLVGELDLANGEVCGTTLRQLLAGAGLREMVLDLADLTFLDCAGLRALIAARRLGESKGVYVRVERPQPMVSTVLIGTDVWDDLVRLGHDVSPVIPGGRDDNGRAT